MNEKATSVIKNNDYKLMFDLYREEKNINLSSEELERIEDINKVKLGDLNNTV